MLSYKSYYNIAPPYLCKLINKKESHVNTRLGTDHHQLIMPPISKDCSNTFIERSVIYDAPCERNTLSENIRRSNFDCFRKSVRTIIIIIHIYIAHYSHCALMRFLKNPVIPLLNTHRSYTEKMKVFSRFLNIVIESALWIFRGSSFHNLAA